MTLVKFKNEIHPFQKWVNETLDAFNRDDFSTLTDNRTFGHLPPVNVKETKDQFQLELVAPGRNKNDFNITLEKDLLTISNKVERKTDETDEKWNRKEYSFASFTRSFSLPDSAENSKINAEYVDGVLKISIAKKEQAIDKGPLEIKVS
ncbi:MAG: Hsp20/alpha crystallin family protein [Chitinophagaceae bacterium]|nr:Hsp20/alpha crystallin family protein [Chitinophagaceae bacterium]